MQNSNTIVVNSNLREFLKDIYIAVGEGQSLSRITHEHKFTRSAPSILERAGIIQFKESDGKRKLYSWEGADIINNEDELIALGEKYILEARKQYYSWHISKKKKKSKSKRVPPENMKENFRQFLGKLIELKEFADSINNVKLGEYFGLPADMVVDVDAIDDSTIQMPMYVIEKLLKL